MSEPPYKQKVTLRDYERRDDLCSGDQTALYYLSDYGSLIRVRGKGWYCTNDCRRSLVGVEANDTLAQPTLGPFATAEAACEARESAP